MPTHNGLLRKYMPRTASAIGNLGSQYRVSKMRYRLKSGNIVGRIKGMLGGSSSQGIVGETVGRVKAVARKVPGMPQSAQVSAGGNSEHRGSASGHPDIPSGGVVFRGTSGSG